MIISIAVFTGINFGSFVYIMPSVLSAVQHAKIISALVEKQNSIPLPKAHAAVVLYRLER